MGPPEEPGSSEARRLADERARDAENAINKRIFETSQDLILVVGRQGDFIRVSPSAERMLGYTPEEMTGHNGREFVHPDDIDGTRAEMRLGRLSRTMRTFDCRYVHKDGTAVPISWTGVWSEPEQQHFFIGRDMSDRIAAEERLQRAQRLEAVGQLTGGLAHDFNNLLSVIVGNLELLRESPDAGPEALELIDAALDASFRGASLTRQLLAFARRQSLDARAFDMNDRVSQTLGLLRRTLGERIEVSALLAPALKPAFADAAQFESALVNLAINARDAMPDGGRLVIETTNVQLDDDYAVDNVDVRPGHYVVLAVTDNGTGMPPDILAKVFEPFFTTKGPGQGSGLGLSMVYGYAKQSQGHVKIYSEPGRGTTVRLYLPAAGADTDDRGSPTAPSPGAKTTGERILLVEDDDGVRAMALAQLRRLGYQVAEAENADAALDLLHGGQAFDLLFTDVVMPGTMTGDQLARAARELRPGIKVLLTSGFATGAAQSGPRAEDFRNLLSKPYRIVDLAAKLREVLDTTD